MVLAERILLGCSLCLTLLVLAGLAARRLYRLSYGFTAYLLAVAVSETLIFIWPHRFFTWSFWLAKETAYGLVKLVLALELTFLAYQAFPSAHRTARRVILAVLLLVLALVVIGVPYAADFPTLARELLRRLAEGTALVFAAAWGLVLWYRLPLHRLHRAILRGLVPYLLVFAAARSVTLALGWDVRKAVNLADAGAYVALLAYWAWEVWRRGPEEPEFLRTLQPWRARVRRAAPGPFSGGS
jgi:hypothetical protein